jgi:large subunit ribosomal protein L5
LTGDLGQVVDSSLQGLREQVIFPEIDYDEIDKVRGMDITIVTTAKTDEEARELLKLMGMPFRQ